MWAYIIIMIVVASIPFLILNYYNTLPIVDAEVVGKTLSDGYEECVIDIDGSKSTSRERPCIHEIGDKVKVSTNDNYVEIRYEEHGISCEPSIWRGGVC